MECKKARFNNIDLLRFIGALIIVLFHIITGIKFYYQQEILSILKLADKIHWGFMWVDFFFIVSGFFLFYTTDFKKPTYKFVLKKLIRLLPVLIFALVCYKLLSLFNFLCWQKYINIYTFTLLSNIGLTANNTMGNLHSTWFISSLFWGYLFYFYLKQLLNEKWFNFIVAILVFFSYIYLTNTTFHPPLVNNNFICAGMMRVFGGLGLGYFIHMFIKVYKPECKNIFHKLLFTVSEGYILFNCIYITVFYKIPFDNLSIAILLFASLITIFLLKQGLISQIINNKVGSYLGRYAYSIIVTHIIIFDLMKMNFWDANIEFLSNHLFFNISITMLLSILFGMITYHLIEQPACMYLAKRLESTVVAERERNVLL